MSVKRRTLQGLIFGLVLFLLYINDLSSVFDKAIKIHFLNSLQYKTLIILVLFLANNLFKKIAQTNGILPKVRNNTP